MRTITYRANLIGKKQLPNTMKKAHELLSWVAGTIGIANLGAQFFMNNFDFVILFKCFLSYLVIIAFYRVFLRSLLASLNVPM